MKLVRRESEVNTARDRTASLRSPVTLRLAETPDASELERLAQLDSRRLPPPPHLVAVREDRLDAAISLSTGEVISDPFTRTAELRALLRWHAGPVPLERDQLPATQPYPRPALATT